MINLATVSRHSLRQSLFASGLILVVTAASVFARPVPGNLVNGLDKIVEDRLIERGVILPSPKSPLRGNSKVAGPAGDATTSAATNAYKAEVKRQATTFKNLAIVDSLSGKYLVDIVPNGRVPVATLQASLIAAFPATQVTATDTKYAGHGLIEGYISLDDASDIAESGGVGSVVLQLKPIHSVGAVTEFGVNQHRVNRVSTLYNAAATANYDGAGISIGVMSDSYNSQPSMEGGTTTAQQDVVTGDLPGIAAATPTAPNTKPVVVLQDYNPTGGATNEGRGMCQIVADVAPQARIGFATADTGELGFANNIRALGALDGFAYPVATQQGFKADVICDDVSYLDEPVFQDGIIAQGVIDVVNAGITYCSSAANNYGTDGYDSDFRPVANGTGLTAAAGNTALAGTNINLTGVDPALYAGGFHNFNAAGLDVAQTFNTGADPQGAVFQWNDPYDSTVPTPGLLVFGPVAGSSTLTTPSTDYPVVLTANQAYLIIEKGTPAAPTDNFDAIIDVINPAGTTVLTQDTGTDETVYYVPPTTGTYKIRVRPFATSLPVGGPGVPTMGPYTLQVNQTAALVQRITQDFNLLFFRTDTGAFISAVAANNFASNRPYEIFVPTFSADGYSQVQLVISRSNTTAPANAANHFKYVFFGNGVSGVGAAEYNNYLTPVTFGHSAVVGANSIAAYSCFRPNLPEDFTSPGPVTIYFDTNNNRLATPQVRRKPDFAAADGSNNTFFPLGAAQDVPFDADTNYPNFYGTSAASPHAAALAALVIQSHKPAVLTPAQVKTLLQLNAFPHDLDPFASGGTAAVANGGTVSVNVVSDNDTNTGTGSNDPNSWSVAYTGSGRLQTLSFNPEATGATGGNPTGGNFSGNAGGATTADFLNSTYYKFTPGMVFNSGQFKNTGTSTGLTPSDATATFTNAAPAPSTNAYYWTLNLTFGTSNFTGGKVFRFNVGRNQQQDAQTPQGMTIPSVLYGQTAQYSADILGDGVLIPEYADSRTVLPGMTFSGTVINGTTTYPFSGRIGNKIGVGYSPLDGYGFINVEAATKAALPVPGVVSRMVHGTAGSFDIPLPLTGTAGIECRASSVVGSYQLVYTFDQTVAATGAAAITQGTATVDSVVPGPLANQVTVNLTGVANAQHLAVALSNVPGNSGTTLATLTARMDVLFGDVNANGSTDSGDLVATRNIVVQTTDSTNFRFDVNASGQVDSGDLIRIRSASVTSLP